MKSAVRPIVIGLGILLASCSDLTEPPVSADQEGHAIDRDAALQASINTANAGRRVIVLFESKPDRKLAEEAGAIVDYEYEIIPALAVRGPGQAISRIASDFRVVRVEPDVEVELADFGTELSAAWGVQRIGAGLVHEDPDGTLGTGVKVGVLDTGCDYNHPDLAANYAGGWDFVNGDDDPMDDAGHGTHVSGTIAAVRDAQGVVGVAPDVELYCLKMLNDGGFGDFSDAVAAMDWAVAHGLQVTNHSYSSSRNPGTAARQAFDNAAAAGMISVAAAGNGGDPSGKGNTVAYPARFETAIAVAATDASDVRASFSATGGAVELAAPGVLINSLAPGGGYTTLSGTSMASPHVAGVAALLLASGTPASQVRARLQNTAEDLGDSGRDNFYGYGLVRADAAVLGEVGNTVPTALFTFLCTGLSCDFDGSASTDSDGTVVSYAWDFGDGTGASGPGPTVSHTFTAEGTYEVILTVTDDGGATDDDTKSVYVSAGGGPVEGPEIALVALTGSGTFENDLMVMDADGSSPTVILHDEVDRFYYPSFSPAVTTTGGFSGRIAYETRNADTGAAVAELRVVDFTIAPGGSVSTDVSMIVSSTDGGGWMSSWSPDGEWLAFVRGVEDPEGIYLLDYRSGVPGAATLLVADPFPGNSRDEVGWPTWSPDGSDLAFTWCEPLGGGDCEDRIRSVAVDLSGASPAVVPGSEVDVAKGVYGWALDWSRSGNFIAYKSGTAIRVLDVNGVNQIQSLGSTQWAESPTWPPDTETELVFMNRHGKAGTGKRRIVRYDLATGSEQILYERKGFHLHSPDWRR